MEYDVSDIYDDSMYSKEKVDQILTATKTVTEYNSNDDPVQHNDAISVNAVRGSPPEGACTDSLRIEQKLLYKCLIRDGVESPEELELIAETKRVILQLFGSLIIGK